MMLLKIGGILVPLLLSGWVTAGEADNTKFTVVNSQGGQDKSLDNLQNENRLNQERVLELEQKMIELLQQLKGKEEKTSVH